MVRLASNKRNIFALLAFAACLQILWREEIIPSSSQSSVSLRSNKSSFFSPGYLDVFDKGHSVILAEHYTKLIGRYAEELKLEFKESERFSKITKESTHVCKGQIGRVEASMLYIMIRENKPQHVVEIGALCGSSTRWILAALRKNGFGKLTTFDLSRVAPKFIEKQYSEPNRWNFHEEDAFTYFKKRKGRKLVAEIDLFFIDALHRNFFAKIYTQELLAKSPGRSSVFCHDIYSPFLIPPYKKCQKELTEKTIAEEISCINQVAKNLTDGYGGADLFYGPSQPGGEGYELMNWLARTGRSSGVVTFSPYAAPDFAAAIFAAFRANGMDFSQINNPAVFFELRPY